MGDQAVPWCFYCSSLDHPRYYPELLVLLISCYRSLNWLARVCLCMLPATSLCSMLMGKENLVFGCC